MTKYHRMHIDPCYPWRKEKRFFNSRGGNEPNKGDAVYEAYNLGQYQALYREAPRKNPYPPGRRHDEWQRGYEEQKWELENCGMPWGRKYQ